MTPTDLVMILASYAVVIVSTLALQDCYTPAKAPPIDPSPVSTVEPERAPDGGK